MIAFLENVITAIAAAVLCAGAAYLTLTTGAVLL
jgi:hypothetical protein